MAADGGQEIQTEFLFVGNEIGTAGFARHADNGQKTHFQRLAGFKTLYLKVCRKRQRDVLSGMCEIDVKSARGIASRPLNAKHVAVGDEGMRSDQDAAGAENRIPTIGESP